MKRAFILLYACLCMNANAQNYLLSFAGSGASSTVGTVKVENLNTGASLVLSGTDILRLTGTTGIESSGLSNTSELKIYPNPMTDYTNLLVSPPISGNALISVCDMTGKVLTQIQGYLDNSTYEFRLTGLKSGFYMISVRGNSYQYNSKLLSNCKTEGILDFILIGNSNTTSEKAEGIVSKGSLATVDVTYTSGDRLKFTGTSGNFSTVKTDIITSDKTITFDFVACTDGDNINYPIVQVGSQVWMAENLKSLKYRNGDLIGTTIPVTKDISGEIAPKYQWACAGNESNVSTYGRLYTWYTVTDSRSVCPSGWHIPSDEEWIALSTFLDGEVVAGGKLKETGTTHWNSPNTGATNLSGFTSLPSAYRNSSGVFINIGVNSRLWSSTESFSTAAWSRMLEWNGSYLDRNNYGKEAGFSVRCIKDESAQVSSVSTNAVSDITYSSATCGGNVTNDGGVSVTSRGVCWSTSSNPTILNSKTVNGEGLGPFTSVLTGLASGTKYYVRAYATNSTGTVYGSEVNFTTNPAPTISLRLRYIGTDEYGMSNTFAVNGYNFSWNAGEFLYDYFTWRGSRNSSIITTNSTLKDMLGCSISRQIKVSNFVLATYLRSYVIKVYVNGNLVNTISKTNIGGHLATSYYRTDNEVLGVIPVGLGDTLEIVWTDTVGANK